MNPELLIPAAFLAGFFGSTHCIGMCGAIVVLFEGQQPNERGWEGWLHRGLYNLGRLGLYVLLGAFAGIGGALLTTAVGLKAGLILLRMIAGLLVIAIGLNLLFDWRFTDVLERTGGRLWRRLSPLARHVLPINTPLRALAAGLLWGALPCGLVYSAVAVAATSGSMAYGALIMFAFWLGTAPALLLAGYSARRLSLWKTRRPFRRIAGVIIIVIGLLALMPLGMRAKGHQHGTSPVGSGNYATASSSMQSTTWKRSGPRP